jgi:hypothetical protein
MQWNLLRGAGVARAKIPSGTTYTYIVFMTLKEINLGITAEDVRQTGGDRLFPLDIYTHTKSGRVRITDAQLLMSIFELLGSGAADTSSIDFLVHENLTVASGSVTTTANYTTGTISILDEDGNAITSFTEDGDNTGISGLGAYDGTVVRVDYDTPDATGITSYALHVNDLPLYFELTQSSNYIEPSDNSLRSFQVLIYRLRMVGNLEFTFRHGEFSAPVLEAEILDPGRSDEEVVRYKFGTLPAGL